MSDKKKQQSNEVPPAEKTLRTVPQFSQRHPAFSEGSLRWLLFNAHNNGLESSGAIVRLGKRVLLDEDKFFLWASSDPTIATKSKTQNGG